MDASPPPQPPQVLLQVTPSVSVAATRGGVRKEGAAKPPSSSSSPPSRSFSCETSFPFPHATPRGICGLPAEPSPRFSEPAPLPPARLGGGAGRLRLTKLDAASSLCFGSSGWSHVGRRLLAPVQTCSSSCGLFAAANAAAGVPAAACADTLPAAGTTISTGADARPGATGASGLSAFASAVASAAAAAVAVPPVAATLVPAPAPAACCAARWGKGGSS